MYIKLTFEYGSWSLADKCGTSCITATLITEPEILEQLPVDVKADQYSEKLKSFLGNDTVKASFYHDCKDLNKTEVNAALKIFHASFAGGNNEKPFAIIGKTPQENKIITALISAVETIRRQRPRQAAADDNIHQVKQLSY